MQKPEVEPGTGQLSTEQRAIIIAVQANYARCHDALLKHMETNVVADEDGRFLVAGSEEFKVLVAQNALRTCVEAGLEAMIPFLPATAVEFGLRLASYCVSVIPRELHDDAVRQFCEVFPDLHERNMRSGVRLSGGWFDDVPGKPS